MMHLLRLSYHTRKTRGIRTPVGVHEKLQRLNYYYLVEYTVPVEHVMHSAYAVFITLSSRLFNQSVWCLSFTLAMCITMCIVHSPMKSLAELKGVLCFQQYGVKISIS